MSNSAGAETGMNRTAINTAFYPNGIKYGQNGKANRNQLKIEIIGLYLKYSPVSAQWIDTDTVYKSPTGGETPATSKNKQSIR